MPKTLVTLTDSDIKDAISLWARQKMGHKANKIEVRTEAKWAGYGAHEYQVHSPVITYEVEGVVGTAGSSLAHIDR